MKGERVLQRLEQRLEPTGITWQPWEVSADEAESILQILFEAGGAELVESVIGSVEENEVKSENVEAG